MISAGVRQSLMALVRCQRSRASVHSSYSCLRRWTSSAAERCFSRLLLSARGSKATMSVSVQQRLDFFVPWPTCYWSAPAGCSAPGWMAPSCCSCCGGQHSVTCSANLCSAGYLKVLLTTFSYLNLSRKFLLQYLQAWLCLFEN